MSTLCADWASCPGALDPQDLQLTIDDWDQSFRLAYGAAFSPDMSIDYPHARMVTFDGSPADNILIQLWQDGFGGIEKKIANYQAKNHKLKGIRFEYTTEDPYDFITRGKN